MRACWPSGVLTCASASHADGAGDIMWGSLEADFAGAQNDYAASMMQQPSLDTEELSALLGISIP